MKHRAWLSAVQCWSSYPPHRHLLAGLSLLCWPQHHLVLSSSDRPTLDLTPPCCPAPVSLLLHL